MWLVRSQGCVTTHGGALESHQSDPGSFCARQPDKDSSCAAWGRHLMTSFSPMCPSVSIDLSLGLWREGVMFLFVQEMVAEFECVSRRNHRGLFSHLFQGLARQHSEGVLNGRWLVRSTFCSFFISPVFYILSFALLLIFFCLEMYVLLWFYPNLLVRLKWLQDEEDEKGNWFKQSVLLYVMQGQISESGLYWTRERDCRQRRR